MGVGLHTIGEPRKSLRYAAENAFWDLSKEVLAKVAHDEGLESKGDAFTILSALLKKQLKEYSAAQIDEVLAERGALRPSRFPVALKDDALEDVFGKDESKALKALVGFPMAHASPTHSCDTI